MNLRHVLVPTEFGPCSVRALALAEAVAWRLRGRVTLLHVRELQAVAYPGAPFMPTFDFSAETDSLERALEAAVAALPKELEPRWMLRHGSVSEQVLAAARELGADLIVMGTHGRTGLARAIVGSTAEKVVRTSPIPVMTVHADADLTEHAAAG